MSAELIVNGGFETAGASAFDAIGWTRVQPANALRVVDPNAAHTGVAGGVVVTAPASGPPLNFLAADGRLLQTIAVTPGAAYQFSGHAKLASGTDALEIADAVSGEVLSSIDAESATGDWQFMSALVVPSSSTLGLEVRGRAGVTFNTAWYVDDFSLTAIELGEPMSDILVKGYTAGRNKLLAINQSAGFHHSIGGRIVHRYCWPGDVGAPEMIPFICFFRDQQARAIAGISGTLVNEWFEFVAVVFCPLTDVSSFEQASELDALRWEEDIRRALMPDPSKRKWDLDEPAIRDVKFIESSSEPVQIGDVLAHELTLKIGLLFAYGRADLGPGA